MAVLPEVQIYAAIWKVMPIFCTCVPVRSSLQPAKVMEQPHLDLTHGPACSTCQGMNVLQRRTLCMCLNYRQRLWVVSQEERLKTCTCYCFQDGKSQQNKSSDAVESKGVVRQIKKKKERGKSKRGERDEDGGYSRDGLVCPPVFASISVLCALWITTTWSRRNFIMVAAFGCSLKDWSIWLRHSPAMLPMTPQNIQLLGSTEGAGGHQKKRIVALQKKKKGP